MKVIDAYCGNKLMYRRINRTAFEQQDKTTKQIFVNQCGYDLDKSKRATITNVSDGTVFQIKNIVDNNVVYTGDVINQIADFTDFNTIGEYYITCDNKRSYNFKIDEDFLYNLSIPLALKFMEMSRQDAFDIGGDTGYAWRDSHQFSFEINSLVMMYMSNPNYFETLPWDIYKVNECEYEELREQKEPNIIWLIKFGVTRYYKLATEKGIKLHAFIKGQLAYFLYIYPYISKYIEQEFYETIRDFTIQQWGVGDCNKSWYEETPTHNLFLTESKIGSVKGSNPPGYSIIPNLMMYEVLKRDDVSSYQQYFDSAFNSCKWVIDDVDLDDPNNTKGQRMSEYITITGITYFYEKYKDLSPSGLYEKILRLAKVLVSRSENMWDLRQFSKKGDITGQTLDVYTGGGKMNEVGNVAGFPSIAYSICRVLNENEFERVRLLELATTHFDNIFGRNPVGKHYCYAAIEEFKGADLGWPTRHPGGFGNLGYCVGVLDGAPKEESYPFNPNAEVGYTEGWVAFNTAWNTSLAYLAGENKKIIGLDIFSK